MHSSALKINPHLFHTLFTSAPQFTLDQPFRVSLSLSSTSSFLHAASLQLYRPSRQPLSMAATAQDLKHIDLASLTADSSKVKVQRPTDHKTFSPSTRMAPPPRTIDTQQHRDHIRKSHLSLDGSSSGTASAPSSPPPPYPPYTTSLDELSVASAKYFSSYSPSPAKVSPSRKGKSTKGKKDQTTKKRAL